MGASCAVADEGLHGRSRSACVVNGRLRYTGEGAVKRAPPCVVSHVEFSVSQTSSEKAWHGGPLPRCPRASDHAAAPAGLAA